jgi:hypothetical protein
MQDTFFNIDSIFPKRALFSAPAYSFVVGRTAEVADARVLSLSGKQTRRWCSGCRNDNLRRIRSSTR